MKTQFDILRKTRELVLLVISDLSIEQLHIIPSGFNNNIAWNLTHLLVTQQLLHYKLSDKDCLIPDDLIENFKNGTSPNYTLNPQELEEIKELFENLPDTLEEDYNEGIFTLYSEYKTSTGFVIDSIETAISFNNFHESLHLGIIMSIKKLVK